MDPLKPLANRRPLTEVDQDTQPQSAVKLRIPGWNLLTELLTEAQICIIRMRNTVQSRVKADQDPAVFNSFSK